MGRINRGHISTIEELDTSRSAQLLLSRAVNKTALVVLPIIRVCMLSIRPCLSHSSLPLSDLVRPILLWGDS